MQTAGKKIISGQHTQTIPMEEITYIEENTGKSPKLRGFEMLAYSPNINYEDASEACLTEVYENRETMKTALDWAKSSDDGIITLSFHWFSPLGGRDKSFYAEHTDFDPDKVLIFPFFGDLFTNPMANGSGGEEKAPKQPANSISSCLIIT